MFGIDHQSELTHRGYLRGEQQMDERSATTHHFTLSGYVADVVLPEPGSELRKASLSILDITPGCDRRNMRVLWAEVLIQGEQAQGISDQTRRQFVVVEGSIFLAAHGLARSSDSVRWNISYLLVRASNVHFGPSTHPGPGEHRHEHSAVELMLETPSGPTFVNPRIAVELQRCHNRWCREARRSRNRISIAGPVPAGAQPSDWDNLEKGSLMHMRLAQSRGTKIGTPEVAILSQGKLVKYSRDNVNPGGYVMVYGAVRSVRYRVPGIPESAGILVSAESINAAPTGVSSSNSFTVELRNGAKITVDQAMVHVLREYAREYARVHSIKVMESEFSLAHSTLWYWINSERNGPTVPAKLLEYLGSNLSIIQWETRELAQLPSHVAR